MSGLELKELLTQKPLHFTAVFQSVLDQSMTCRQPPLPSLPALTPKVTSKQGYSSRPELKHRGPAVATEWTRPLLGHLQG